MTLLSATILSQSGPGSDGNESVLRIPQISFITKASPSDCLISYLRLSLGGSYPAVKIQLVYSIAPSDWADNSSIKTLTEIIIIQ